MTWTTRMMSDRHEAFLASLFEGRMTKGSGSHWSDQLDGKQARGSGHLVFAWDGKSTLSKTISVGLEMWAKAVSQTRAWETPMLALRFYPTDRLDKVSLDLAIVEASVLADLQREAAEVVALRDRVAELEALVSPEGTPVPEYSPIGVKSWRGSR
jgi:hypothetical protein